ncbi:hypothetical protein AB0425_17855 [Actinosynnema sp. NPDC051121]
MKRGSGLKRSGSLRRTPFRSRGKRLAPGTPMKQRRERNPDKPSPDAGKAAAEKIVRLRPGPGSPCEARSAWCQGRGSQFSHRWHKGQGGPWKASNGLRVCGLGGAAGCHGWIHQHPVEAEKLGWIVLPGPDGTADTTLVPAVIWTVNYGRAWVFLDDEGGVHLDPTWGAA